MGRLTIDLTEQQHRDIKAFAALQPDGQQALRDDVLALIGQLNRSGDGSMVVPAEYLEVVVVKR